MLFEIVLFLAIIACFVMFVIGIIYHLAQVFLAQVFHLAQSYIYWQICILEKCGGVSVPMNAAKTETATAHYMHRYANTQSHAAYLRQQPIWLSMFAAT